MTGVLQLWQALIDFDTMLKQYKLSQKKTGRYQIENVNIKYYDYVIFKIATPEIETCVNVINMLSVDSATDSIQLKHRITAGY